MVTWCLRMTKTAIFAIWNKKGHFVKFENVVVCLNVSDNIWLNVNFIFRNFMTQIFLFLLTTLAKFVWEGEINLPSTFSTNRFIIEFSSAIDVRWNLIVSRKVGEVLLFVNKTKV